MSDHARRRAAAEERLKATQQAYQERRHDASGLDAQHPETIAHAPRRAAHKKARDAVWSALRSGKLKRKPCEVCGAAKTEAHHLDYSKPLLVRWLCEDHHDDQTFERRSCPASRRRT